MYEMKVYHANSCSKHRGKRLPSYELVVTWGPVCSLKVHGRRMKHLRLKKQNFWAHKVQNQAAVRGISG